MVHYRRNFDLLVGIRMDEHIARVLAGRYSLRRVFDVVARGRAPGMQTPPGWFEFYSSMNGASRRPFKDKSKSSFWPH
jgi:hypothetical protein